MSEHDLQMVEEADATGELATLYETIKHQFQVPAVPNVVKTIAIAPSALQFYVTMFASFYKNISLPPDLVAMIFYAVAKKSNSAYFTASHAMLCQKMGIDEAILKALPNNLDEVMPERTRAIIKFVVKSSKTPQALDAQDYDKLRALGMENDEILQIIFVGGLAIYLNIVADALNVAVDPELAQNVEQ